MINAEEARRRSEENYRPKKWNVLDSIQLKRIEFKIYFWSKLGRDYIHFWDPRKLVREKLEQEGYEFAVWGGWTSPYPVITWMKETK